jgi:two-component system NtrC family sensor kinase
MVRDSWLFRKLAVGLRVEIILNMTLLVIAAVLLVGISMLKLNERNILNQKVEGSWFIVNSIQNTLNLMLEEQGNPSLGGISLDALVAMYARDERLKSITIVNRDFRVVAHSRREMIGTEMKTTQFERAILDQEAFYELEVEEGTLFDNYRDLIVFSPLSFGGQVVGVLRVTLSLADVMGSILESQRLVVLFIIIDALVLIVFGSFLLSRVIVKPIKNLVTVAGKIRDGDFDQKIEITAKNEIGQLMGSFNQMAEKLGDNKRRLEDHILSLETANQRLERAHEDLLISEKLASIGRLAAGVAHEVGNPLGAILGYTKILQEGMESREEELSTLRRIEQEIDRINHIVRELLDFSRPTKFEIQELNINTTIENTISLLSHQKSFKEIEKKLDLYPHLPPVRADESQLQQVLINLFLNAADAMPDGGTLTVKTEEMVVERDMGGELEAMFPRRRKSDPETSDYSHLRKFKPLPLIYDKYTVGDLLVRINISDTGCGIKKGDLQKIFDPFFTTKPPDKGTGLGLSISLRIIEFLNGQIKVESQPGKGSTFSIVLPTVEVGKASNPTTEEKS